MSRSLYDHLFGTARSPFSDRSHLAAMLQVECALARAEAGLGIIPSSAAEAICAATVDSLDLEQMGLQAADAGNLAIPFVRQLTKAVGASDPEAARFVHWGATSQDILDSATVLQMREHLQLLSNALDECCAHLAALAETHRETVMPGRTWMQQAVPITLGWKAAGWLDALLRHRERLAELKSRVLTLQFGGAAGTLASLGTRGAEVAACLSAELGLAAPAIPWHTQRDRIAESAAFHGMLAGTLGKIGRDIALCMQTEIAELSEASQPGRGGSSTMPHKRNPVSCAVLLTAATRAPGLVSTLLAAMVQEHERGLGGWQAEWQALPELCDLTLGSLGAAQNLLAGMVVDPQAMRANLDKTGGLILAESVSMQLAQHIGRDKSHALVEKAAARALEGPIPFAEALQQSPEIASCLSPEEIHLALDPAHYLGSTTIMIDNVLASYRSAFCIAAKDG